MCCRFPVLLQGDDPPHGTIRREEFILARSEEDEFDEELGEVMVRTQFPESWLWEEIELPVCPPNQPQCSETSTLRTGVYLKDSITTWQITAISLSKTLGMCVADPYEIIVRKDFFIDLKMPYSAVRNEQLEIKAVIHNYSNQRMKTVNIRFKTSEGICSSASKKQKGKITVFPWPHVLHSRPSHHHPHGAERAVDRS
ncbi:hypothetical protein QQF64_000011 [Cirrhinus molitorella]|uniref:Alpha-2-macroglobulin domain-containing protein n=1 Tax=Cirrhinus molitorella TaxID=172907 RepID=A0ABR3NVX9_9TELE